MDGVGRQGGLLCYLCVAFCVVSAETGVILDYAVKKVKTDDDEGLIIEILVDRRCHNLERAY